MDMQMISISMKAYKELEALETRLAEREKELAEAKQINAFNAESIANGRKANERMREVVEAARALTLSKTAHSDWKGNPITAHYLVSKQTLQVLLDALAALSGGEGLK